MKSLLLAGMAAALFFPRQAQAISFGDAFSGPTLSSGSSVYWGAASLAQKRDRLRFLVDGGVAVIGIQHQRAGLDPNTNQPFPEASFVALTPALSFLFDTPTPLPWLDVLVGGYSPFLNGATWGDEKPQRFFATDNNILATFAIPVGVLIAPSDRFGFSLMAGPMYGRAISSAAFDFAAFANDFLEPGAEPFPPESAVLEGSSTTQSSGWSFVATTSVYARVLEHLRLAAGFNYSGTIPLKGDVEVTLPEALATPLRLQGTADLELDYILPWALNFEADLELGNHRLGLLFEYLGKARGQTLYPTVVRAEPDLLEGRRVTVKGNENDWSVGIRDLWRYDDTWEFSGRIDFDPRSIPDEAFSPLNADFTSVEIAIGARRRIAESVQLAATYAARYLHTVEVTNSLFSNRAPGQSGLQLPSANGTYSGDIVHRFAIGLRYGY